MNYGVRHPRELQTFKWVDLRGVVEQGSQEGVLETNLELLADALQVELIPAGVNLFFPTNQTHEYKPFTLRCKLLAGFDNEIVIF